MRTRIRLTGRRQLPRSSVDAKIVEIEDRKLVSMTIANPQAFRKFPDTASVKLRLIENKFSETLEFGMLRQLKTTAELGNRGFSAPSCQLRVVATDEEHRGLLLGSTDNWTMRAADDDEGDAASEGILMFLPKNIAPRTWKLDMRDDDYPVVYIDAGIPDPRTWVRNDPVFVSCVLPAIVREVFEDLLREGNPRDQRWAKDWLDWADTLMPGAPPPLADDWQQRQRWMENLVDSFCQRHSVLEMLVGHLGQEAAA
jgi:hypothetical protein